MAIARTASCGLRATRQTATATRAAMIATMTSDWILAMATVPGAEGGPAADAAGPRAPISPRPTQIGRTNHGKREPLAEFFSDFLPAQSANIGGALLTSGGLGALRPRPLKAPGMSRADGRKRAERCSLLIVFRATSSQESAPKGLRHAIARGHALLPSPGVRCVSRVRLA